MKTTKLTILLFPLLALIPLLADAQDRAMRFDANTSLMIRELRAILTIENDQITVAMRMGRDEAKHGEDRLEQGDIIIMMNGTRAKDIPALSEIYDGIEDGEEIKIGVRRGEERFIIRAEKGDVPQEAGMVVMQLDNEGGNPPVILESLGLIVVDKDDRVNIQGIFDPILPEELKGLGIQTYTITHLNGKTPENAEALKNEIRALEIGEEFSLVFEKDGETKTVTLKKPASKIIISTDGN